MIPDPRMAAYAADAYHAEPRWQRGAIHACLWRPAEGVGVVGFRGSESILTAAGLRDWIVDLDDGVETDPLLGGVHAGFLGDVRGVAVQMAHDIDLALDLHLTGHSKGAAEAILFAAMLVAAGRPPAQLTTFGCPRLMAAGNTRLPALLAAIPGLDYRHRDDPVPLLPPALEPARPDRFRQLEAPRLELDIVEDHFMRGYALALAAAEGKS